MLTNITILTKCTKTQVYPRSSYGSTARARNAAASTRRPHALVYSTAGDDPAGAAPTRRPFPPLLPSIQASSACTCSGAKMRVSR